MQNFNAKKYEDAINDFSEVIRLNPDKPYAYTMRGICHYLIQIAKIFPRLVVINDLPVIYKAERNVKAIEDFNRAIQLLPPLSSSATLAIFEAYFNRNQTQTE